MTRFLRLGIKKTPFDKGEEKGGKGMAIGFVLINVAPAHETEVYDKLQKISGISESHLLVGDYDMIAKIEAEDYRQIEELVVNKIKAIKGIVAAKTLLGTKF